MYSKTVGAFLEKLFHILCTIFGKMCTSEHGKSKPVCKYVFKPFEFENISPSEDSKLPVPRSGHRIGADAANFYSFGGYNPLARREPVNADEEQNWEQSYPLFQELWKFNYATKRWTKFNNRQSLPMELASNALVLHGNILMVYGGTGSPFGIRCSNQLYVCKVHDINQQMVEVPTRGHHPLPLYGQALIVHNDYLYTIGGTTGLSYTCDVHRLNMKTMLWEKIYICSGQGEYEPEGRYRHEVGYDGRYIYILGGGTTEDAYGFESVPAFDTETRVWKKVKTLRDIRKGHPEPRRCHGAVQVNEGDHVKVFVTGGHDGENIFNDLWSLDLSTYQWTCYDCQLPEPTYFHATAVSPQGRLYIFGGNYVCNDDIRRSNEIYSTWLCIPKLSELCWEAVLHYFSHIIRSNTTDLINAGLPRHFIQRLQVH